MEEKEYSRSDAAAYILAKYKEQGDFLIFGEDTLAKLLEKAIDLDQAFMEASGVANGSEVYDDDAAFDALFEGMQKAFPEHKMYLMRFCEDYLDYNEAYLESIGLIEWE